MKDIDRFFQWPPDKCTILMHSTCKYKCKKNTVSSYIKISWLCLNVDLCIHKTIVMLKSLIIFLEWLTAVDGLTISFKNVGEYFNIYIYISVMRFIFMFHYVHIRYCTISDYPRRLLPRKGL